MEEIKEIEPRDGKYRTFEYIMHYLDGTSGVLGRMILIKEKLYFDGKPSEQLMDSRGIAFLAKQMKELERKIKNGF